MSLTITPEEFLEVFSKSFEEGVRNRISMNTPFKHIEGWSSLTALLITVEMNDTWNIGLSDDEIRMSTTVKDLFQITLHKLIS